MMAAMAGVFLFSIVFLHHKSPAAKSKAEYIIHLCSFTPPFVLFLAKRSWYTALCKRAQELHKHIIIS